LRDESFASKPIETDIGIRLKHCIPILVPRRAKLERDHGKLIAVVTRKEKMKAVLSIVLAMVASFALGQTLRQPLMKEQDNTQQPRQRTTTQTTTTTEGSGTITQYTPGSAIVLRASNGPVRYRFGKTVTYVTRSGRVLDQAMVKQKIRVGVPVQVHYTGTGPNMVVDRVILEQD
jgi:hypothetical protein